MRRSSSSPVPEPLDPDGCFETCRVRRGRVLFMEEHLARLAASLRTLGISAWDRRGARVELKRAARGLKDGAVRIAVRRSGGPRSGSGAGPWILVHRQEGVPYTAEERRFGISLTTVPSRWPPSASGVAQAKISERLAGVLARMEGRDHCEVLRIGSHGQLTEGTASNLFLVREGVLMTPPAWLGVLEGVTRARVLQAAGRMRIPIRVQPFSRHELFNAEEAFLTNVLMGILPVREVDGRKIGASCPGPVTRRLSRGLR